MPVAVYPALVSGDQSQGYQAQLVDFPNLSVSETSSTELLKLARDRLLDALSTLEKNGGDWPDPTPVEALGPQVQAGGRFVLLVDVQVEDTPVRVNISIGDRLLRRLDQASEAQNMTRSGFIAAAVRERLGDAGVKGEGLGGVNAQRLFEEVSEMGRRVNEALGPESAFGRTVAELDAHAMDSLRSLAGGVASAVRRRKDGSPPNGDKA